MKTYLSLLGLAATSLLAASVMVGCAPSEGDNGFEGPAGDGSGGSGSGNTGSTSSGNDTIDPSTTGSGSSSSGGDEVCATSAVEATLTPINMFIMFDKSGSMESNNKWTDARNALVKFIQDPSAAGLRVALRFFPENDGCDDNVCSIDACSQPKVDIGTLTADQGGADAQETALVDAIQSAQTLSNYGTPMYAALGGAEKWAAEYVAAKPNEKAVVVLVTDGSPNGCNESINAISSLAADAQASSEVLTYAVGLKGSNEGDMNAIASAGGTSSGFFVDAGANAVNDLVAALQTIQGSQVACEFSMPQTDGNGNSIDPEKVNVLYSSQGGAEVTIGQVSDAGSCTDQVGGWYYDDPSAPSTITLCPSTCAAVQSDQAAKVSVEFGCATKPAT